MTATFFVIGGAGFIGSHLVDALVQRGPVTVLDDLSNGRREFIEPHLARGAVRLIQANLLDLPRLTEALAGHGTVFHLAANPEARRGLVEPRLDLEQGTIGTWNVVEAMRRCGVPRLVFASSGTVYGETSRVCREDDLGELPISLYGASKLAGEALVSAFCHCFGIQAWIFRFGNVVGPRGTHGAALDFLRKLAANPGELEVLGDGRQAKPYLHVTDCVAGILCGLDRATEALNVFNVAPSDVTCVARIAELCAECSPEQNVRVRFTGGTRGWPGDVPQSRLDSSRLAALGWQNTRSSDQAVREAVAALALEVFGTSEAGPACKP